MWPWAAGTPLLVTIALCNYLVVFVVCFVLFFCSNLAGHCTDKRAVILDISAGERQFRICRKFEPAHYLGDTGVFETTLLRILYLSPSISPFGYPPSHCYKSLPLLVMFGFSL